MYSSGVQCDSNNGTIIR